MVNRKLYLCNILAINGNCISTEYATSSMYGVTMFGRVGMGYVHLFLLELKTLTVSEIFKSSMTCIIYLKVL
jgi:hypothetical protein